MAIKRDFSSVTPSAKVLLFMKSLTDIPFAKEAVHLLFTAEEIRKKDVPVPSKDFFGRLLHFENRYWSIDKLMEGVGIKNIIELSSGFSFRGLDKVLHEDVYYIDTDLPDLIADKKQILTKLLNGRTTRGTLITEPLNVLDENAFLSLIDKFPAGPVCIINEGLLMYLDVQEKQKLAAVIHKILKQRGGCWITADIYVRNPRESERADYGPYAQEIASFRSAHHIEENKFGSIEAAQTFFDRSGFRIVQTEILAYDRLSSLRLLENKTEINENIVKQRMGARQTWMLKVRD